MHGRHEACRRKAFFYLLLNGLESALTAMWYPLVKKLLTGQLLQRQEQFETSSDERLPQAAPNAVLTSKGVKDVVVHRNTVLQQTCVALLRSCAETFAGPPSPAQIQQMRVWDSIVTAQPRRFDTAAPARGRAWNTKKKHTN